MPKTKCRKKWRGGLKETIELMLIRPPQLQFFRRWHKNYGDGYKIIAGGKLKLSFHAVKLSVKSLLRGMW